MTTPHSPFFSPSLLNLSPVVLAPAAAAPARAHPRGGDFGRFLQLASDDRESVEVTRRRTGSGGPRERADAPAPRQPDEQRSGSGGGGGGGYGGGGGGFSGGDMGPSSGGQLPIGEILALLLRLPPPVLGILLLLVCCAGVAFFFFGGNLPTPSQTAGLETPLATNLPLASLDEPSPTPFVPAAANPSPTPAVSSVASGGPRWLVMLYQDAKDRVLDEDIFTDLNEAERAGSTDRVRIVSQIDRYRGPQNRGEWSTAKRFIVTRDADLHTVHSQQVADLGQVNMAAPQTLVDFVTWAVKTYPADKYVLIMSDHGMGWPGGWSDPAVTSVASQNRGVPLVASVGNLMYLNDLDHALTTIRSQAGVDKFELVGLDACLMSQMEVLDVLAAHARYGVVSEETEPALGWAYAAFLDTLNANPGMSGAELARSIVQTYITDDQRIVDNQARAELVGRGSAIGGLFGGSVPSAAQVAQEMGSDVTLTAVDLQSYPALLASLNHFSFTLQQADSRSVSQARSYAQSFTSIFGKSVPPSYIDLGNWVQLLARGSSGSVANASQQLLTALQAAVIAEKHGPGRPGATGIAIYFPTSQLYSNPAAGAQSYTAIADRFARDSLWDEYLTYFYTGRQFTEAAAGVALPSRGATITAPAAGGIQVSPLKVSGQTAAPGRPLSLSVDVDGKNVGYVKLFVGYYDRGANSINVADEDYLQSSQTRQVQGVYYPVWPASGRFTVKFSWDPIVFGISDGRATVPALFRPENYGASAADAEYSVEGTYTFADGSGSRAARLYFRDKQLRKVFGFAGDPAAGAPWEITPKPGDTFTVSDKWMDLDAQGNVIRTVSQKGRTLTFGAQPFQWKDLDAAAGEYVVGFIVQDLDGNETPAFQRITVQ